MDVKESFYEYCCMKEGCVDESHVQVWSGWVYNIVDCAGYLEICNPIYISQCLAIPINY
jgi:hypothetical protein